MQKQGQDSEGPQLLAFVRLDVVLVVVVVVVEVKLFIYFSFLYNINCIFFIFD